MGAVPTIANRDIRVVAVGTAQARLCPPYGPAHDRMRVYAGTETRRRSLKIPGSQNQRAVHKPIMREIIPLML
jgi:hypothetical protein